MISLWDTGLYRKESFPGDSGFPINQVSIKWILFLLILPYEICWLPESSLPNTVCQSWMKIFSKFRTDQPVFIRPLESTKFWLLVETHPQFCTKFPFSSTRRRNNFLWYKSWAPIYLASWHLYWTMRNCVLISQVKSCHLVPHYEVFINYKKHI